LRDDVGDHVAVRLVLQHDRQLEAIAVVRESWRRRPHLERQARGERGFAGAEAAAAVAGSGVTRPEGSSTRSAPDASSASGGSSTPPSPRGRGACVVPGANRRCAHQR